MSYQFAAYPCDRGIKNNALSRGYHNFILTPGADRAACTYCGQLATSQG